MRDRLDVRLGGAGGGAPEPAVARVPHRADRHRDGLPRADPRALPAGSGAARAARGRSGRACSATSARRSTRPASAPPARFSSPCSPISAAPPSWASSPAAGCCCASSRDTPCCPRCSRCSRANDGAAADQRSTLATHPRTAGGWRLICPGRLGRRCSSSASTLYAPRTGFNPNLIELQDPNLESVQLVRKLQTFSAVVLSKDLDLLRRVRDAVKDLPTRRHAPTASSRRTTTPRGSRPTRSCRRSSGPSRRRCRRATCRGSARRREAVARSSPAPQRRPPRPRRTGRFTSRRPISSATFAGRRLDRPAVARADREAADRVAGRVPRPAQGDARASSTPARRASDELPPELRSHYVAADGTIALYIYPKDDLWDREQPRRVRARGRGRRPVGARRAGADRHRRRHLSHDQLDRALVLHARRPTRWG